MSGGLTLCSWFLFFFIYWKYKLKNNFWKMKKNQEWFINCFIFLRYLLWKSDGVFGYCLTINKNYKYYRFNCLKKITRPFLPKESGGLNFHYKHFCKVVCANYYTINIKLSINSCTNCNNNIYFRLMA